jgi:hypothetical protein
MGRTKGSKNKPKTAVNSATTVPATNNYSLRRRSNRQSESNDISNNINENIITNDNNCNNADINNNHSNIDNNNGGDNNGNKSIMGDKELKDVKKLITDKSKTFIPEISQEIAK